MTPEAGQHRPRRIAVIAQNDLHRDARVLKEVRTLVAAGHHVEIFGMVRRRAQAPPSIAGAERVTLINVSPRSLRGRIYATADRVASSLAHLLPVLGVTGLVVLAAISLSMFVLAAAILAIVGLLVDRRILKQRLFQALKRFRDERAARWRGRAYAEAAHLMAKWISSEAYDVLHCHDMIPLMAGVLLKRRNPRLRLIWDAHELYEETATAHPRDCALMRKIISEAQGSVDAFVTINETFRTLYQERYPGLPAAHVVMNAAVDNGPAEDDGRLRRATGLAPDQQILLFQGALLAHRGLGKLVEAARLLPPQWSIVIMGDGPMAGEVRTASAGLASGRPVQRAALTLLPPVPQAELTAWTAGATLGIIPYDPVALNHLHCTPNKLWEYPAAGVPILATALPEMARLIQDWGTGFLLPRSFHPHDVIAALNGITTADLASATASCRTFIQAMSWSRFEPHLLEAYRE